MAVEKVCPESALKYTPLPIAATLVPSLEMTDGKRLAVPKTGPAPQDTPKLVLLYNILLPLAVAITRLPSGDDTIYVKAKGPVDCNRQLLPTGTMGQSFEGVGDFVGEREGESVCVAVADDPPTVDAAVTE